MKETELKPCPFCGGKAETHYQPLFSINGVCIKCTECNARSRFFPCDSYYAYYHGEKNVHISKERATSDAINMWNRRATDERAD
jgi:Lar family restriction alleviation protein